MARSSSLWQASAVLQAEQLIRDMEISALPICPFSIARERDIEVKSLPPHSQGVSGVLLRSANEFGILYATYLSNDGFEGFLVSHELGHYFLPGHPESVLTNGWHTSYAGFISIDRHELEADHFAAGLLMPEFLFQPALNMAGTGFNAINKLSGQCRTSLTATAMRYVQCTPDATAIVISTGNRIDYCFMSDPL